MKKEYDFWLIDSNSVGVIRFYKNNENFIIKNDITQYVLRINNMILTTTLSQSSSSSAPLV